MKAPTEADVQRACERCGATILGKPSKVKARRFCSRQCSMRRGPDNPNWRGGMVAVCCSWCGVGFRVIPARVGPRLFCRRACQSAYQSQAFAGDGSARWRGGAAASRRRYLAKVSGQAAEAATRSRRPRLCKGCGQPGVSKGRRYHPECRPRPKRPSTRVVCRDCGAERVVSAAPLPKRCQACDLASRAGSGNSNWKGGVTPENRKVRQSTEYADWRRAVFERDDFTCVACGQRGGELHADHIKPFAAFPELRLVLSNGRTLCVECHKKTDSYLSKGKKLKRELLGTQSRPGESQFPDGSRRGSTAS